MARAEREDSYAQEQRDAWGRLPGDPWFGIPPGDGGFPAGGGKGPLAPGVTPEENKAAVGDIPWNAYPIQPPITTPSGRPSGPSFFTPNTSNYGAPPEAFGETYSAGTYTAPAWQEAYRGPTIEDLLSDPGYQTRFDAGLQSRERAAAARGSLLSGGHLKALNRYGQEYAANEYGALNQRRMAEYAQRYGEFSDAARRGADAFATNEAGRLNQFTTRYKTYQDAVLGRRESERDRWQREMDLANLGLNATTAGR